MVRRNWIIHRSPAAWRYVVVAVATVLYYSGLALARASVPGFELVGFLIFGLWYHVDIRVGLLLNGVHVPFVLGVALLADARWPEVVLTSVSPALFAVISGLFYGHSIASVRRVRLEQEWVAQVARQTSDVVTITDVDGVILYVTPSCRRIYGYTPAEMLGTNAREYMAEPDRDKAAGAVQRLATRPDRSAAPGTDEVFVCQVRRKDGTPVWVESIFREFHDGQATRVVSYSRDVSERMAHVQEIERKSNELAAILQTLPGSINVVDRDYRVILASQPNLRTNADVSADSMVGMHCYTALYGRSKPCPHCIVADVLRTGEPAAIIAGSGHALHRLTGRTFKLTATPIIDATGDVVGAVDYATDVTDLHVATEQAQEASRAKSAFLANMSHEIRTPLNGMVGALAMLAETDLNAEQREFAQIAHQSGSGLLSLINDILEFSRIEAGKLELRPEPFQIQQLVDQVFASLRTQAAANDVRLSAEISETAGATFVADAARLRQILLNLAGNSVKFTRDGAVIIRASVERYPEVRLCFEVCDTGVGIRREKLSHVFDQFTQVENTYTRSTQGTGLGLSIVRSLVTLMGGTVSIDSREGEGTTVRFWVAVDDAPRSARTVSAEKSAKAFAHTGPIPQRVIVAEDNRINQIVMRHMLDQLHVGTVQIVSDGQELLDAADREAYDVALVDIQMPKLNGFQATAELTRRHPDMVVVGLTAYAGSEERQRLLDAGAYACLTKPVEPADLARLLSDLAVARARVPE